MEEAGFDAFSRGRYKSRSILGYGSDIYCETTESTEIITVIQRVPCLLSSLCLFRAQDNRPLVLTRKGALTSTGRGFVTE